MGYYVNVLMKQKKTPVFILDSRRVHDSLSKGFALEMRHAKESHIWQGV